MNPYKLQISADVKRQIALCRASIRATIGERLQEIVDGTADLLSRTRRAVPSGPPLRFYVFEGYRVSYQVNPVTRSIRVLSLSRAAG